MHRLVYRLTRWMSNSSGSVLNFSFQSGYKDDSFMPKIHVHSSSKGEKPTVKINICVCDTNCIIKSKSPPLNSPYVVKWLIMNVNKKWVDLIDFLINSTSFLAIKIKNNRICIHKYTKPNGCKMFLIIKNEEYARVRWTSYDVSMVCWIDNSLTNTTKKNVIVIWKKF